MNTLTTVNLTAMAEYVWEHGFASPRLWRAWEKLTGLPEREAWELARDLVGEATVTATVAPF